MSTSESRPLRIRGARAALSNAPVGEATSILISGARVAAFGDEADAASGCEDIDADGLWALPGWIDVQVNDIEWLARGLQASADHASRVREVLAYQLSRGVTGCVLATLAAPLDEIIAYLAGMKLVLDGGEPDDAAFLGGLVEGTFMNPRFHGAHNPDWVLPPDEEVLESLLATGAVRMINIAPETSTDAIDLVASAAKSGVVVGCGHANPHAERLREAVDAGMRYIIHLGNGPTGSHWKRFHDGGMLEESLRNDDLIATIIVDGWHVHPSLVRDWIARKEVSRTVGVSDAGFALGPPEGRFEVFGIQGEPADDGAYLRVVPKDGAPLSNPLSSDVGALFGAAIGMREVFENLVNLLSTDVEGVHVRRHEAMPLESAIDSAAQMCSENPARLLGLTGRGSLRRGDRADLVLVEIRGEPGKLRVQPVSTFLGGRRVADSM
jgi:N-acetylglucosamine-6-phosphate deacetylase